MDKILVSSDHHANWEALEKLFQYAQKENIPFIINGDIIGEYNFEKLAQQLNILFPYQITNYELQKKLNENEYQVYMTNNQVQQVSGNIDYLISKTPENKKEEIKQQILSIIEMAKSPEFQNKLSNVFSTISKEKGLIINNHKLRLKALYNIIVEEHVIILANLIDKYKVKTYFLAGNHEPIYFSKLITQKLKNKNLFVDLNKTEGILNINNFNICGVSNVNAISSFYHEFLSEEELNNIFPHQRGRQRPILFENITPEILENSSEHLKDFEWAKIFNNNEDKNQKNIKQIKNKIDIFLTHGQIGQGAWRDDKHSNVMPTLHIAAVLSYLSKITIDAHLHTNHEMKNPLGKTTIRAIGNKGYVLSKDSKGKITHKLIEVDAAYDYRGKIKFDLNDLKTRTENNLWEKK